jgi:alpha-1,6-mannosyltransferase
MAIDLHRGKIYGGKIYGVKIDWKFWRGCVEIASTKLRRDSGLPMIQSGQRPSQLASTALASAALCLALVFASLLLYLGLMKYHSVMAGGPNFHDFPVANRQIWQIGLSLTSTGLIGLYSYWLGQTQTFPQTFGALLKPASPFLVLAFLAYAYSSDGYLYLHYGSMALHGVNPYIHSAKDFVSPLSPLLHWAQSATYGPVSMAIFVISASFVPLSPLLAFFVLKGFCLLAHVLNAYGIHRSLQDSPQQAKFTALYLLNPVLLNEFVSNVHVDVFLTTTVIVFIGCLYQRHYVGAMLALWAGCLTKTLPILWIPLLIGYLIRQRQWRSLGLSALLSLLLLGGLTAIVFPSLAAWRSLVNPGVAGLTARSLYHGLNVLLNHGFGVSPRDRHTILITLNGIAYGGFFLFYAWLLWKPHRWLRSARGPAVMPALKHLFTSASPTSHANVSDKHGSDRNGSDKHASDAENYDETDLVQDLGWLTLALFLGVTPWLMPWYSTILMAIALLSRRATSLYRISLVFCLSPGFIVGAAVGDDLGNLAVVGMTVGPAIALLLLRFWREKLKIKN